MFYNNNKTSPIHQRNINREFKQHLALFLIMATLLFFLNIFTNYHHPYNSWWFFQPIALWGIIVFLHSILSHFGFSLEANFDENTPAKPLEEEKGIETETYFDLKELERRPNYDESDLV